MIKTGKMCIRDRGYYDRQKFDVSGVEWNDTSKVYAIPIQTAEPYKLIYSEMCIRDRR